MGWPGCVTTLLRMHAEVMAMKPKGKGTDVDGKIILKQLCLKKGIKTRTGSYLLGWGPVADFFKYDQIFFVLCYRFIRLC